MTYARDPRLALLDAGMATPDPLQLGLAAEPDGCLLGALGEPQSRLYGIGSLLRGSLWECTAMPEIRAAASRLAQAPSESKGVADMNSATQG